MVGGIACFIAALTAIVAVVLGFDRPPQTKRAERLRNTLGIAVTVLVIVGLLLVAWSQAS